MKLELIINNFIHNHENIIILTKSTCVGILTGLTLNANLDHAKMVNTLAAIPPTDANLIIEIAKIVAVEAENESDKCFNYIVDRIIEFRETGDKCLENDFFQKYKNFIYKRKASCLFHIKKNPSRPYGQEGFFYGDNVISVFRFWHFR